jgi:hypothetical protein
VATRTRFETLNGDEKKNARAGRRLGSRRSSSRPDDLLQDPTIFFKTRRSSSRVESTPLSSSRHPPAVDVVSGTRGVARALGARRVPPAAMPRIGESCSTSSIRDRVRDELGYPGHRREAGHPPRRGNRAPFGVTGIPDQPTAPAASPRAAGGGGYRSPACRGGVSPLYQSPVIVNIEI